MSSTTVSVPKYRHHKGSGQAFVQVNGRRHYLGKWDSPKSKEAYARFVAELAVSPGATTAVPLTTPASQFTVVELCRSLSRLRRRATTRTTASQPRTCLNSKRRSGLPMSFTAPLRPRVLAPGNPGYPAEDGCHARQPPLHQSAQRAHQADVQVGRFDGDLAPIPSIKPYSLG